MNGTRANGACVPSDLGLTRTFYLLPTSSDVTFKTLIPRTT